MSPRGTDASVTTPFRSTEPKMVWLCEITTGISSPAILRYVGLERDVTFDGQTFSSRPVRADEQAVAVHTNAEGTTLEVADLDGAISAYITSGAFVATRVRIWLTDVAALGGATAYGYLGVYIIESVVQRDGILSFDLRPLLSIFGLDIPLRTFTRTLFPGLPTEAYA